MDVNCQGANGCFDPSGTNGVLSTSITTYAPAYAAAPGWDFATGLGTVNAFNLVTFWNAADLTLGGTGSMAGSGVAAYTLVIANAGPQPATGVVVTTTLPPGAALIAGSSSAGCTQSVQVVQCTVAGSLAKGSSDSVTVEVQSPAQTLNLTFSVSSNNPNLVAANATAAIAAAPASSADGPPPLWSYVLFAAMLCGIAAARQHAGREA
jgi:uncharacterized repeat protein (TIGR01451 family)